MAVAVYYPPTYKGVTDHIMKPHEYVAQSKIPLKMIYWFADKRIISNPLTDHDVQCLEFLEKIWGKHEVLRCQLARISKKRRQVLISTADLTTKWERYAFSRFQNLAPGKKLSMDQLMDEIELTFGFALKAAHIKRLYQVRRKAYYQRGKKRSPKSSSFVQQPSVNKEKETAFIE